MNRRFNSHPFWGSYSPLSALGGAGILILASGRFAFALVCAGALIWVYGLSALVYANARVIMPARGRKLILLFLSTFFCGILMLLISLMNPLLILSAFLFLILIPPCCVGSGLFECAESVDPMEFFSRCVLEAVVFAGIILGFALIREPLGMGTLSFPGGAQGITELFGEGDEFIPLRILSSTGGGFLLLGYGIALFRYVRKQNGSVPEEEQ